MLDSLTKYQLLLLYTLVRLLKTQSTDEVTTSELKDAYTVLCSDLDVKEHSPSRIAEFLKSLEGQGIISQKGESGKLNHIRLFAPLDEVKTTTRTFLEQYIDPVLLVEILDEIEEK